MALTSDKMSPWLKSQTLSVTEKDLPNKPSEPPTVSFDKSAGVPVYSWSNINKPPLLTGLTNPISNSFNNTLPETGGVPITALPTIEDEKLCPGTSVKVVLLVRFPIEKALAASILMEIIAIVAVARLISAIPSDGNPIGFSNFISSIADIKVKGNYPKFLLESVFALNTGTIVIILSNLCQDFEFVSLTQLLF